MGETIVESAAASNGIVAADSFYGGGARGLCYQITQGTSFVVLTDQQATEVCTAILADVTARRVASEKRIAKANSKALTSLDAMQAAKKRAGL